MGRTTNRVAKKDPILHRSATGKEMVVGYSYTLHRKLRTHYFDKPISKEMWKGK